MAELIQTESARFRLEGDLYLGAVGPLAAAGARLAAAGGDVELDLGGIGRSSSAGVALLLEWTEQVRRAGGELRFVNWPEPMVRIAGFSNVGRLLGIEAADE